VVVEGEVIGIFTSVDAIRALVYVLGRPPAAAVPHQP
jgi:hypothetical protein